MSGFKSNVKHLHALARNIKTKSFKEQAQEIVSLYVEKRIRNVRTVENAIYRISQPRYQRSGQAEAEYRKLVDKYSDAEPMTGRLERESLRKKVKTYSATMMLFKKVDDWDKDKKKEPDPTMLVEGADTDKLKKSLKQRKYQDLRQFYIGTFDIRLDGVDLRWLNEVHETLLRKDKVIGKDKKGNDIVDPNFKKWSIS
jgi:hypothetical protein